MKTAFAILCLLLAVCAHVSTATAKPGIKLADDKFPTGHDTPEGVACDLARAIIRHDIPLFTNSCLKPYDTNGPAAYNTFLRDTIAAMKIAAAKTRASPDQPESIGKAYAARHLRKNDPFKYGRATFGFQDVMFVDVGIFSFNGAGTITRTLVIKDKDGKWYALPAPQSTPQLSTGLTDEKPSKDDFSKAYDVPD